MTNLSLADIAQTPRLPDTKKGEPAKSEKGQSGDMKFAHALTREEQAEAAASGATPADTAASDRADSASNSTAVAESDPSTRLRLALNLASAITDVRSAGASAADAQTTQNPALPIVPDPSALAAAPPSTDAQDLTSDAPQGRMSRRAPASVEPRAPEPDQKSSRAGALKMTEAQSQAALPKQATPPNEASPAHLPAVSSDAPKQASVKSPAQERSTPEAAVGEDKTAAVLAEPLVPAPVEEQRSKVQDQARSGKAAPVGSSATDTLALLQSASKSADPMPSGVKSSADGPAKKPDKSAVAVSSTSDSAVVAAPPVSSSQMALNLLSVLVSAGTVAPQQAVLPAQRNESGVAGTPGGVSGDSSARPSTRLSADAAETSDFVQNPDMALNNPAFSPLRSDQSTADRSLSAATLNEHLIRATLSGNGASNEMAQSAPVTKVKVLEVETHLPVATQSDSLFGTPSRSGHLSTAADIGIDDTGPAGATDANVASSSHQTALRTLNLALSGEDSAPLSVRMRLQGDQLNVAISSQHADAIAAILRDHSNLSDSLIGAGYKLDNLSVQVSSGSAGSMDNSGSGAAPGQGQMSRHNDSRSDHMNREQQNAGTKSPASSGSAQKPEANGRGAGLRPRSSLYI